MWWPWEWMPCMVDEQDGRILGPWYSSASLTRLRFLLSGPFWERNKLCCLSYLLSILSYSQVNLGLTDNTAMVFESAIATIMLHNKPPQNSGLKQLPFILAYASVAWLRVSGSRLGSAVLGSKWQIRLRKVTVKCRNPNWCLPNAGMLPPLPVHVWLYMGRLTA